MLVRVHSQCLTGDVFGSQRCDCGPQMHAALRRSRRRGRGRVPLPAAGGARHRAGEQAARLRAAGPGARHGRGEREARLRRPTCATTASARRSWPTSGVREIELLTNNPRKIVGLEAYGLRIVERVPIRIRPTRHNRRYLATKRDKLGHLLDLHAGGDVSVREIRPRPRRRRAALRRWWRRASTRRTCSAWWTARSRCCAAAARPRTRSRCAGCRARSSCRWRRGGRRRRRPLRRGARLRRRDPRRDRALPPGGGPVRARAAATSRSTPACRC